MRKCTMCLQERDELMFRTRKGRNLKDPNKEFYRSHCRICERIKAKEYRLNNLEKTKESSKRWGERNKDRWHTKIWEAYIKREFGITSIEYANKLFEQNYCCAICGKPETQKINGKPKRLAVDHDHFDGQVRGLLCASCNKGLGCFKDDIELVMKAYDYLVRFKKLKGIA